MNEANEIILYQPDSTLSLNVRVENETVWLTQQQIADLFGTKRPAITKHLSNIFKSGELDEISVCSILELTAADGKKLFGFSKMDFITGTELLTLMHVKKN